MPQGAKGAFPERPSGPERAPRPARAGQDRPGGHEGRRSRANECAKGAFPDRGLGRAKTLPDDGCAQRDSGVTPERHQVLQVRSEAHETLR